MVKTDNCKYLFTVECEPELYYEKQIGQKFFFFFTRDFSLVPTGQCTVYDSLTANVQILPMMGIAQLLTNIRLNSCIAQWRNNRPNYWQYIVSSS